MADKKWIVLGAGKFGREVYYFYGKENIAYFVDNNSERVGDSFFGKEIISFKQYCKIYRMYNTIIAARYYQAIERQLLEKGITEYRIYLEERESIILDKNEEGYKKYLYTPTFITKIDTLYFIVDCWHHRIIYSPDLNRPIPEWEVLDDALAGPHSIVSDGDIYIVDDTDHGEVCVYKKEKDSFIKTQTVYGLGFRPHKCLYDENRKRFYVLLSESCEIAVLKNTHGRVETEAIVKVETDAWYARSIELIDGNLFLVCRNGSVYELSEELSGMKILHEYKVPDKYAGVNDIIKIGGSYYLSVYTDLNGAYAAKVVKADKLENLRCPEDVTEKLGIRGIPYYFSMVDGRCYLTEIDTYSGISSYHIEEDKLSDRKELFSFGEISDSSLKRRFGKESPYDLDIIKNTNIAIGLLQNGGGCVRKLQSGMIPKIAGFYIGRERENLVSWYPFEDSANVLEIVSECGSIAGVLCEKCKAVTSAVSDRRTAEMVRSMCREYENIEIDMSNAYSDRIFDYILTVNPEPEKLDGLLKNAQKILYKNGKILLIINNKLSETFWKSQGWTTPFREEQMTKKEIELICKKWDKECLFYYPLPDWTECEMVCSDFSSRLSISEVLENVLFSRPVYNAALWQIIENHSVSAMAKSFFVEISDRAEPDTAIAVNVSSTRRKKEYQLNTTILTKGYVEKSAVYKKGVPHIRRIQKNEMALENRGIPVLKGKLQKNRYVVEYSSGDTLDKYIYQLCKNGNVKEAFRLLNILRQYIFISSPHKVDKGREVLETGYPDMVCQNVLFDKNQFLFFDQEWTIKDVEPEFIVYRGVKLLYLNHTELEKIFPQKRMLEELGISERAEEYEAEDILFRKLIRG